MSRGLRSSVFPRKVILRIRFRMVDLCLFVVFFSSLHGSFDLSLNHDVFVFGFVACRIVLHRSNRDPCCLQCVAAASEQQVFARDKDKEGQCEEVDENLP